MDILSTFTLVIQTLPGSTGPNLLVFALNFPIFDIH